MPTVTGDTDLAALNPCSYRGYVYDQETGYYYLQSRYYDPEIGGFLNSDAVDYLGVCGKAQGHNLFLYCENNPVNNVDTFGFFSFKAVMVAGIAGGIWSVTKYTVKYFSNFNWKKALGEFAKGFLTGAIIAALTQLPRAVSFGVVGAVFEVITYVGECISTNQKLTASKILEKACVGYSLGLYANGVRIFASKMGLSFSKMTSGNLSLSAIVYVFIQAVAKGYLTDFFSW